MHFGPLVGSRKLVCTPHIHVSYLNLKCLGEIPDVKENIDELFFYFFLENDYFLNEYSSSGMHPVINTVDGSQYSVTNYFL